MQEGSFISLNFFGFHFVSVLQKTDPLGQPTKSAHPGTVVIVLLVESEINMIARK